MSIINYAYIYIYTEWLLFFSTFRLNYSTHWAFFLGKYTVLFLLFLFILKLSFSLQFVTYSHIYTHWYIDTYRLPNHIINLRTAQEWIMGENFVCWWEKWVDWWYADEGLFTSDHSVYTHLLKFYWFGLVF